MDRLIDVLIIEDDPAFAAIIGMTLQTNGKFSATVADSGSEGISQLKTKPYDIILLDYRLGDINGLQVLEWMNEQKMETPVIMMTSHSSEELAVEAMKLGAYDYVKKEQLELDHLHILIHGVHERYLFRKEKEVREREKQEQEKREAAIQMFQTTVRTIAHHINKSLAVFSLRSSSVERNMKKTLPAEEAEKVVTLLADLRRQANIIEAVVRSLVQISDVVYTKYAGDQDIIDIRSHLEQDLEMLKEQKIIA